MVENGLHVINKTLFTCRLPLVHVFPQLSLFLADDTTPSHYDDSPDIVGKTSEARLLSSLSTNRDTI